MKYFLSNLNNVLVVLMSALLINANAWSCGDTEHRTEKNERHTCPTEKKSAKHSIANHPMKKKSVSRAQSHAPIGVMGDHLHDKGEWMFSYRYMTMLMEGSQLGRENISTNEIIQQPNRFSPPANLRVVPTEMTMDMHMLGAMYAPSKHITLMAMFNFIEKDMEHTTFMGMMGDNVLGEFTTKTSGVGDTKLSALIRLEDKIHTTLGVSIPTGSIDEKDTILTPMNSRPEVILPYPMQLGSGTTDLILGLTYVDFYRIWNWGLQWRSEIRTESNSEGYRLGDEHGFTGWLSYALSNDLSISSRLNFLNRGKIDGQDDSVSLPVQTADPDNYGFNRLDFHLGVNTFIPNTNHRIALEVGMPVYQDLNGVQLETDQLITLGWQYSP